MAAPENFCLPTIEQLQEISDIGIQSAKRQSALRINPKISQGVSNGVFFMPRAIDGYETGETEFDDYYWNQRFIGRIGINGKGGTSLRLHESTTAISELLGLSEKVRTFYVAEWHSDEITACYKYDHYEAGSEVELTNDEAPQLQGVHFLFDKNDLEDTDKREPQAFTEIDCEALLARMRDFTVSSVAMHFHSLGVRESFDSKTRVGMFTEFQYARAQYMEGPAVQYEQ